MKLYKSKFKNASFEVRVHPKRLLGEDESDRIELIIRPSRGRTLRYLFNVVDSMEVIAGLSYACAWVLDRDLPYASQRKPTQ